MPQLQFDKQFALHLGLSKTATTTFQELFFAKHPQIFYLGKYLSRADFQQCRDQCTHDVLSPLLWKPDTSLDSKAFRDSLTTLSQYDDAAHPVWLASWEELGNREVDMHLQSLRRIQKVFGTCRLLVCLRNTLQRIPSEYLQSLRYHFIHFCTHPLTLRSHVTPLYVDFDTWLKKQKSTGHLSLLLGTSELIRQSCETLGKANVGVFLYEDYCQDPLRFVASASAFLGIECLRDFPESDPHQTNLNPRLTEGQVNYLKWLQRFPWRKWMMTRNGNARRKQLKLHGADAKPAKPLLSKYWIEEISEMTRGGNRWLADSFNLPLEQYGYAL